MVAKLLISVHVAAFRGALWLLKLPIVGLCGLFRAALVMMGEELRRWAGVVMAGLLIWVLSIVFLTLVPSPNAKAAVAIMGLMWLAAMFKAASLTMDNRLWKARQRQTLKKLSGDVSQIGERVQTLRGEVIENVAQRTKGTPVEGVFRSNRDARIKERKEAQATEERQEQERLDAATRRAEEAQEADRQERWAQKVNAEHNPFDT